MRRGKKRHYWNIRHSATIAYQLDVKKRANKGNTADRDDPADFFVRLKIIEILSGQM